MPAILDAEVGAIADAYEFGLSVIGSDGVARTEMPTLQARDGKVSCSALTRATCESVQTIRLEVVKGKSVLVLHEPEIREFSTGLVWWEWSLGMRSQVNGTRLVLNPRTLPRATTIELFLLPFFLDLQLKTRKRLEGTQMGNRSGIFACYKWAMSVRRRLSLLSSGL